MNQLKKNPTRALTVLKALLASYVISGVVLLFLAFIMFKLDPPNGVISIGIIFTYIFSAFAGGVILGKCTKEKRFLWGIMIGILYFIIIFLISIVMNKSVFGQVGSTITVFLMCTLGGMLGGMIS